ncbi:MAG: hypothetical protein QOE59_5303 [Actinomycetota bacterium]|jgi:membrane protein DedA with SNARE-associated domain|nr:hypothetical protein [Actinomycetota bacterium]
MSPPPELPGVLASLGPALDSYGYLAAGGLLFLEDFGVPVPGETILIAAAVYAGAGSLNIALVIGIGVVAAVAGDNVGFAIGFSAGAGCWSGSGTTYCSPLPGSTPRNGSSPATAGRSS